MHFIERIKLIFTKLLDELKKLPFGPLVTFYHKFLHPIVQRFLSIYNFLKVNHIFTIVVFVLLLYVIFSYLFIFKYDSAGLREYSFYTNALIVSIGAAMLFSLIYKAYIPTSNILPTLRKTIKQILLVIIGFIIVGFLIYGLAYASVFSNIVTTVLTLGITITSLYFIYRHINKLPFVLKLKSNPELSILYHAVFLIPCFLFEGSMNLYNNTKQTPAYVYKLLAAEVLLISSYFLVPYIKRKLYTYNSTMLLNDPIYINKPTVIGTFEQLKPRDNQFNYNYGLSFWTFIDNLGANYNDESDGFIPIFSYGDKPTVSYNIKTHTLRITSKNSKDGNEVIYESDTFQLQKWNNFVINYDGGNIDIFLNSNLVATKSGVIPYMTHDNIQVGSDDGLQGGVCNVQYYKTPVDKPTINTLYSTLREKTPPVVG